MIRQPNADKFAMFFENMYIFMYITITGRCNTAASHGESERNFYLR